VFFRRRRRLFRNSLARNPQKKRFSFGVRTLMSIVGVLVLGFAWAFAHETRLIASQAPTSWIEDQSADCAVVVTGGPSRIREGFDLLERHQVQKLIISGVNPQAEFREIFPLAPYYGEVHERDVILERRSRTTYGNAQQTLPLTEAFRCRDLILITSRAHMYRALKTFRAEFPTGFPILARAVVAGPQDLNWTEVSLEAIKSMFYSLWAY
jgi:uncharacterized SAM-binding protein YcdF (DUF218 family)